MAKGSGEKQYSAKLVFSASTDSSVKKAGSEMTKMLNNIEKQQRMAFNKNRIDEFTRSMTKFMYAWRNMSGAARQFGRSITMPFTAISTAAVGATAALYGFANASSKLAIENKRASSQTGLSMKDVAGIRVGAAITGGDFSGVVAGINTMMRTSVEGAIKELRSGKSLSPTGYVAKLAQVGIGREMYEKGNANPIELLRVINKQFTEHGVSPERRVALLGQIFGGPRSRQMSELIEQFGDYEEWLEFASKTGLIITDATKDIDFRKSQVMLQMSFEGLRRQIGVGLYDSLISLNQGLVDMLTSTEFKDKVNSRVKGISDYIIKNKSSLIDAVAGIADLILDVMKALPDIISAMKGMFKTLLWFAKIGGKILSTPGAPQALGMIISGAVLGNIVGSFGALLGGGVGVWKSGMGVYKAGKFGVGYKNLVKMGFYKATGRKGLSRIIEKNALDPTRTSRIGAAREKLYSARTARANSKITEQYWRDVSKMNNDITQYHYEAPTREGLKNIRNRKAAREQELFGDKVAKATAKERYRNVNRGFKNIKNAYYTRIGKAEVAQLRKNNWKYRSDIKGNIRRVKINDLLKENKSIQEVLNDTTGKKRFTHSLKPSKRNFNYLKNQRGMAKPGALLGLIGLAIEGMYMFADIKNALDTGRSVGHAIGRNVAGILGSIAGGTLGGISGLGLASIPVGMAGSIGGRYAGTKLYDYLFPEKVRQNIENERELSDYAGDTTNNININPVFNMKSNNADDIIVEIQRRFGEFLQEHRDDVRRMSLGRV